MKKIIFFCTTLGGRGVDAKFDEPDADKNGELDVFELCG